MLELHTVASPLSFLNVAGAVTKSCSRASGMLQLRSVLDLALRGSDTLMQSW